MIIIVLCCIVQSIVGCLMGFLFIFTNFSVTDSFYFLFQFKTREEMKLFFVLFLLFERWMNMNLILKVLFLFCAFFTIVQLCQVKFYKKRHIKKWKRGTRKGSSMTDCQSLFNGKMEKNRLCWTKKENSYLIKTKNGRSFSHKSDLSIQEPRLTIQCIVICQYYMDIMIKMTHFPCLFIRKRMRRVVFCQLDNEKR